MSRQAGNPGTAFRYLFATDTLADMEAATLAVTNGEDFAPGYFQVYGEGAAMRRMGLVEPFERLAVFFKNLALGQTGEQLAAVEAEVKALILEPCCQPRRLRLEPAAHATRPAADVRLSGRQHRTHDAGRRAML